MSRIQSVQQNYQKSNNYQRQAKPAQHPSFGAEVLPRLKDLPAEAQNIILDGIRPEIKKKIGRMGWIYQRLADTSGEMQNQSINAIFTSTLAPFWIAFNPFTKKSKEDKEYLALRQPISALIAISGGFAMTVGINRFMDKIYNDGYNKDIDLRPCPNKTYIKRKFKRDHSINKNKAEQLKDYIKKIQDERREFFAFLISEENPESILKGIDELQEKQKIKVPNLDTAKKINEYLDANNLNKLKFGDFLKNRFGFEFHENGKFKPIAVESTLSKVNAMDFLEEMGLVEKGKVSEDELRKTLAIYQQERNIGAIEAEIFNEKVLRKDGAKKLQEIAGKIASRITQMTVGEEIGKARSISLGQFFHQLQYKADNGELQKLMDMSMADVLAEFKDKFEGKLKGFNNKAGLKEFAENMLKINAKRLEKHAKNYKNYTNIFFNLFATAITCTILNWAYPRIVKGVFPNLVKDDKKGGNK
ncbi:MAG: hypothetical protein WCY19_01150 [Candidatus Gastranaerophilaceae bacterium]